ncbi:lamin tail domain-containing protein, partial [Candidatus Woesearchaeota archaeon]|nr:lamin tail domain-containing protein [Candidatus Woesearchaeota archaeon]
GLANWSFQTARDGNNFYALLETRNFTDGFYNITAIPEDFAGNKEINHVVISEVLYESAGGANSNEWIELYNPTNYPINITNWIIDVKSASSDATIANESVINPKSSFIIADNSILFFNLYGFYPDLDKQNLSREFKLIGTNDFIRLKDSTGAVIDEVSWGNNDDASYNWSLFADEGRTIARNPASGDVDEQYDWQPNATATPKILVNPNHITIKIDNTPPQIISFNGRVINGAFLKGTETINATVTDALSAVNSVIFRLNKSSFELNLSTSLEGSSWNASLNTINLEDGNYTIRVLANDTLGNLNDTETITVTIDNTPPTASSFTPTNLSFVNVNFPTFSALIKDNVTGVNASTIDLNMYVNGNFIDFPDGITSKAAVQNGFNVSGANVFSSGDIVNVTITAKDNNGNLMPTVKWSFGVDLVKPIVASIQLNDSDRLLRSTDVTNITLDASNGVAGIKNVTIGNSTVLGMANVYSTTWQLITPVSAFGCIADGPCALSLVATDNAGNVNDTEKINLMIDNLNPRVNNILVNNTIVSNFTAIRINLTISDDNYAIGTVTASNGSSVSLSNSSTEQHWIADTNAAALGCPQNGDCSIRFTATDSAGNINQTESIIISVDSSPPSISNAAINDSNNIVQAAHTLSMTITAADSNSIISIKGNNVEFSQAGSVWSATNLSSDFCSSEGLCTVAFAVQDNLSNSNSSQTFAFTIDNTAPALSGAKANATSNISNQNLFINFSLTAADTNDISSISLNGTPLHAALHGN